MPWIYLLLAGIFEIGWATGMKYSNGFTRLVPSVFTVVSLVGSLALLALAERSIPIGTAYAVWVGVGAVGVAVMGIVLFGEAANPGRLVFLGMLVVGIVGLKLVG